MINYLLSLGLDRVNHSGTSLLYHLLGTKEILQKWDAPEYVCDAGLFHSVYGTEYFYLPNMISTKVITEVRELIGEKAERLAWTFSSMKRKDFEKFAGNGTPSFVRSFSGNVKISLTSEDVSDLCNITIANILEQFPRLEEEKVSNHFLKLKPHILPKAYDDLVSIDG